MGDNTRLITGSDEGEVIVANAVYKGEKTSLKIYNYYADDFMNSIYFDAGYKDKVALGWLYSLDVEYINQQSTGYADEYLNNTGSVTGGKQIAVNAVSFKLGLGYGESKFDFAFSNVLKDNDSHDSLVLPWDGTPLYTNAITSNDLFQSNYGQALTADSVYIGGSQGLKFSYTQKYDFTGLKGFKTVLAYLHIDNDKFEDNQEDINAVIAYGINDFSLALKGIWVSNNTSARADGSIKPKDDKFTQYRVIANYKF